MGSPLTQSRVRFEPGEHRSSPIDLSGYVLRGVFSPDGHALGKIGVVTAVDASRADTPIAFVPLELVDGDDYATMLRVAEDWPLWKTWFDVEVPRDDEHDLILLLEHRG